MPENLAAGRRPFRCVLRACVCPSWCPCGRCVRCARGVRGNPTQLQRHAAKDLCPVEQSPRRLCAWIHVISGAVACSKTRARARAVFSRGGIETRLTRAFLRFLVLAIVVYYDGSSSSLALLSLSLSLGARVVGPRVGTTRKYNITNCNAATKQSPNSRRAGTALGRLGEGRSANTSERDSHAHRSEKQLRWSRARLSERHGRAVLGGRGVRT